jgi:signal transduction histidine kinase
VAEGAHSEELRGLTFPIEGSISGDSIRTGRPILIADTSTDERAYQPVARVGEMGPAMFVPLSVAGKPFGTLLVCNRHGGRQFGEEDQGVVESFADQAAVALEYARAQREVQRLAVLEDRERIAKELHDGVIQSLFAIGMGLQGTGAVAKDPDLEDRIASTVEEVDRVIRDLRNYIFGLRPGILADRQLHQALRHLADDFQLKSGVLTIVDVDEDVASELTARAADIIQLTREALSNVGRHAEAATCRVSLRREKRGALLEIDDDGKGFDPSVGREGGQGLDNLRARADTLGGEASIESTVGEGTTVRVLIPM